jgi:TRAP-type C4-dicarboxylate transport system permease small subunit
VLFNLICLWGLPIAAGVSGYLLIERYFREQLIPYQFHRYGWAVAAGTYFFVLAFFFAIKALFLNRRPKHEKNNLG